MLCYSPGAHLVRMFASDARTSTHLFSASTSSSLASRRTALLGLRLGRKNAPLRRRRPTSLLLRHFYRPSAARPASDAGVEKLIKR